MALPGVPQVVLQAVLQVVLLLAHSPLEVNLLQALIPEQHQELSLLNLSFSFSFRNLLLIASCNVSLNNPAHIEPPPLLIGARYRTGLLIIYHVVHLVKSTVQKKGLSHQHNSIYLENQALTFDESKTNPFDFEIRTSLFSRRL